MYSIEQLEILMLIAESQDPMETALQIRKRWAYMRRVALGLTMDPDLLQVLTDRNRYARVSQQIVEAIDEWLAENTRRESA